MKKRTIKIDLSQKSIQNAISQIRKYQSDLEKKNELFVRRLAELGYQSAVSAINDSPIGRVVTVQTDIKSEQTGCKAILIATGKTVTSSDGREFNLLLAIEFGAGIRYNHTANPKAKDFGMGVGTFPGQTHAYDEKGWYYLGEDNEWHHSYGIKATMPMYWASVDILNNIRRIAKEVFGS